MRISIIKVSLRVLALLILVLLVYSTYEIAIENSFQEQLLSEGILGWPSMPYKLTNLVSVLIIVLFVLLTFGLVKLNKTSIGWKQLNMEIYICLLIGLLHNFLSTYQWSILYPFS
jgi:hypothetical protein